MTAFNKRIAHAVESQIFSARAKCLQFIGCDITAMQLHELFYHKNDVPVSLRMSELTTGMRYTFRYHDYCSFSIDTSKRCTSGVYAPLPPKKVSGDVERLDPMMHEAFMNYRTVQGNWEAARTVFNWVQEECNSPKEVRSIWPEIIYLMHEADKPMAVAIDKWTPLRRYIEISPHMIGEIKAASAAVQMWSLLPDKAPEFIIKPI